MSAKRKRKKGKTKAAALPRKRVQDVPEYFAIPSKKDFEDADIEFAQAKAERLAERSRSIRRAFVAVFVLCVIAFAWMRIDSIPYVETPATIVHYSDDVRVTPMYMANEFGPHWFFSRTENRHAVVKYYFEGTEYERDIKLFSAPDGMQTVVYCNQNNPWDCRATKVRNYYVELFLILIFVIYVVILAWAFVPRLIR